ncbi:MAG: YwqG family protein [Pleurocapsa sp.]
MKVFRDNKIYLEKPEIKLLRSRFNMNYKLDVKLSKELEPYRSAIEATIKPYIKIELTDNNSPTWWQSKFGGLPYMPKGFDYPKSNDDEYLYLLAQINFAEVPNLEGLPPKGILQFYLAADDDLYGCDFDNPLVQDKFRVIYFPEVDLDPKNLLIDFNFLPKLELEDWQMPFQGCCQIKFDLQYSPIGANDYKFNFFDLGDEDDEMNLWSEYWDEFDSDGHKLLGYPCFTQEDPRYDSPGDEPYILLFQTDSDRNNNGFEICWGDAGIANFFIKRSHLEQLDFTQVLYNWDCS